MTSESGSRFDICDAIGIWVIVPKAGGRFETTDQAQAECDARNHADGLCEPDGTLPARMSAEDLARWRSNHRARTDCTCNTGAK